MIQKILVLVLSLICIDVYSQTVGVVDYSDDLQPGYTLFSPTVNENTYLIDECGSKINEWNTIDNPGMMGRLTEEGSLIYARRVNSNFFSGGGIGGSIDSYSWDGELEFSLDLASKSFHQHHDFVILPSGNFLALGWEKIDQEDAEALGRETVNVQGMYSEKVIEIEVIDKDEYNVVWEWSALDHIMQDLYDTIGNYGVIADHPERININFTNNINPGVPDWLHCNSLDYNPELDQIIVNSRNFGEFWIIDHSTTTEEAKGSTGGNSGMGGDLLYRWGNPISYNSGVIEDRKLFGQHDVSWVPKGLPGSGQILIFNNGLGRPEGQFSTVEQLVPPLSGFNYVKDQTAYGPFQAQVLYGEAEGPQSVFSIRISGAQRLSNGNTLICIGVLGRFIEIDLEGEIVWDYINPSGSSITTQGQIAPFYSVFQAVKYEYDFAGLQDKDLTAGEKIELEPTDNCSYAVPIIEYSGLSLEIYNDIQGQKVVLKNPDLKEIQLRIYNIQGSFVEEIQVQNENHIEYATDKLSHGVYLVQLWHKNQFLEAFKFIVTNE